MTILCWILLGIFVVISLICYLACALGGKADEEIERAFEIYLRRRK